MSDAIIVALITAGASVLCNILLTRKTARESEVKRAVEQQIVNDRLSNIEIKLDIHNGYADKLGDIQTSMAVLANEIKNMKGA